jgi:Zn finger protein HypA/HybF involved in hydrogenase expression
MNNESSTQGSTTAFTAPLEKGWLRTVFADVRAEVATWDLAFLYECASCGEKVATTKDHGETLVCECDGILRRYSLNRNRELNAGPTPSVLVKNKSTEAGRVFWRHVETIAEQVRAQTVSVEAAVPCRHCKELVGQHHNNRLRCPGMDTEYEPAL